MQQDKALIDAQIRYFSKAGAWPAEIKNRLRCAKHWVRRRGPGDASDELLHVMN